MLISTQYIYYIFIFVVVRDSLQDRHTFIPTTHFYKWWKKSHAKLPSKSTSLWLERAKIMLPHPMESDRELLSHPDIQTLGFYVSEEQIDEARRRNIPIYIGDADVGRFFPELAVISTETISGVAAVAGTSSRIRIAVLKLVEKMRHSPKYVESMGNLPQSISMNRRMMLGILGAYLTFPATEKLAQYVAPKTGVTAMTRKLNGTIHPEDFKYTIQIRNAIHALMLEFMDETFHDSYPCSMFGASHSGIIDELGKTRAEKLKYLQDAGVGKLSNPPSSCWEIQGFYYEEKLKRYTNGEVIPVPELYDLFHSQR